LLVQNFRKSKIENGGETVEGGRRRQNFFHDFRLSILVLPLEVAMQHAPGFLKIVQNAKSRIRELTIDQVWSKLSKGERFHFVDTREDDEWRAGHAKGAVHIGKGVLERDVETKIPDKNAEIVLYCGGGFRSALAADALRQMGYTNVFSMDGGIKGWREKKLPEEKD
jgi:rhodanese-related sulfurtransferase